MAAEPSLGETFSRVAERVTRLLVQHVQLMRSELEEEARLLGARGRTLANAAARAVPFLIAGIVLISIAAAQFAGLILEPWLGQFAAPLATMLVGGTELLVAGAWLRRAIEKAGEPLVSDAKTEPEAEAPEKSPLNGGGLNGARGRDPNLLETTSIVMEEKPYGSVG
jgi:hypothetical protein